MSFNGKESDQWDPSMSLLSPSSLDLHKIWSFLAYDIWEAGADPRVSEFPLMKGGPWWVIAVIAGWLYFVKVSGPRLMKDRPAYDLRRLILVYNMVMMVTNAYFFISASSYTNFGLKTWGCTNVNPSDWGTTMKFKLLLIWFFFISKFIDLLETVFFVLRKKHGQISFLHVFHHSIVPIDVWVGFKYSPSESACFFPLINSLVHTLMYLYYGLSTLGPAVRPYLWWKPYLTQLQIFQLVLVAIHCVHLMLIPDCNIPKAVFAIYLPQVMLLVYLFVSFFIHNYVLSKSKSKQKTVMNGIEKSSGVKMECRNPAKTNVTEQVKKQQLCASDQEKKCL